MSAATELPGASTATQTTIDRRQITQAPGTDASESMAFITNNVPGAVVVHDQLHIRGGHQVTWALDGVPIPNTNIASNLAPQFNPKDVDVLEVQTGGYAAEYGDRTYAVINMIPRSGFQRNREAEIIANYGSYNGTDNQISFGDHTQRFAYYASLNGNRTDYGLETPTSQNLHNQGAGVGGLASLIFNSSPRDQLRLSLGGRADFFQIPNTPEQQANGVRDHQREQDAFTVFHYTHSHGEGLGFTVAPFYHYNRAAYEGAPADVPIPTDDRKSQYAGGDLNVQWRRAANDLRAGIYAFAQHDNEFFGVVANDGTGNSVQQHPITDGALQAFYVEDQWKPRQWLTVNGGIRLTRFSGLIDENAASPRVGGALRLPKLGWVLRATYSRFYQAPPLSTISGPLLDFAATQGFSFLPLKGERDEQHEFGVAIPLHGWSAEFTDSRPRLATTSTTMSWETPTSFSL